MTATMFSKGKEIAALACSKVILGWECAMIRL
jgi:hypothetical protein